MNEAPARSARGLELEAVLAAAPSFRYFNAVLGGRKGARREEEALSVKDTGRKEEPKGGNDGLKVIRRQQRFV